MAKYQKYRPLCLVLLGFILGIISSLLMKHCPNIHMSERIGTQKFLNEIDVPSTTKYSPQNVRVLCWIMTSNRNLVKKALHVKQTWVKRCDKWLFISDRNDTKFPALGFNTPAGRGYIREKATAAFDYIFKHHINDAEWFFKADDDTYVIMENLKYMLSVNSPEYPMYIGHPLTSNNLVKQGFNSGGAGYALSRKALQLFGNRNKSAYSSNLTSEDITIGRWMERLGVKVGDGRDKFNRTRFHMNPLGLFVHKSAHFPRESDGWNRTPGLEYVSDYAISFHHLKPKQLHELEYYTYRLTVYGQSKPIQNLNKPPHALFHKYQ